MYISIIQVCISVFLLCMTSQSLLLQVFEEVRDGLNETFDSYYMNETRRGRSIMRAWDNVQEQVRLFVRMFVCFL